MHIYIYIYIYTHMSKNEVLPNMVLEQRQHVDAEERRTFLGG